VAIYEDRNIPEVPCRVCDIDLNITRTLPDPRSLWPRF
jgi:hypothetical protein